MAPSKSHTFCGRTRREFLWQAGGGFAGVALAEMLGPDGFLARQTVAADNTTPFSEDVVPSLGPAKYVFEINAGLAEKLDISAGDKVSSPSMGLE